MRHIAVIPLCHHSGNHWNILIIGTTNSVMISDKKGAQPCTSRRSRSSQHLPWAFPEVLIAKCTGNRYTYFQCTLLPIIKGPTFSISPERLATVFQQTLSCLPCNPHCRNRYLPDAPLHAKPRSWNIFRMHRPQPWRQTPSEAH